MKYFEKFGHTCSVKSDEVLENYLENRSRLQQAVVKWTTIDPQSEITTEFFNSHSSVVNGMRFHLEQHPTTIHPFSRFKFVWECYMILVFLNGLVYAPLLYMYYVNNNPHEHFGNILVMQLIKVSCIVDMILRFFTGFVDEKNFKVSICFYLFSKLISILKYMKFKF